MQLPFIETANIAAIQRLFKETFGDSLYWNVAPNTNWAVFSVGGGYTLDSHQQTWLADRYKPNSKLADT